VSLNIVHSRVLGTVLDYQIGQVLGLGLGNQVLGLGLGFDTQVLDLGFGLAGQVLVNITAIRYKKGSNRRVQSVNACDVSTSTDLT